MNALNFVLLNLAVIATSFFGYVLLNRNGKFSLAHLLIGLCVLYFSEIFIVEILLGIFGALNYQNVSVAVYALTGSVFLMAKNKILPFVEELKSEFKWEFNYKVFLVGVLIIGPALAVLSVKFFNAILQVPTDFDALVYHLTFVTEWLQTGDIMPIHYTAFAGPLGYYPSNFDLFYLWSILPFENDFLLNLINFPLFGMLFYAVYRVSINFGVSKKFAALSSCLIFYMPLFLQQMGAIFVDLFFVLTLVMGVYFLQELYKNPKNIFNATLFGLAIGLFMGTKYLGLPYTFLPILVFIIIVRKSGFKPLFLGGLTTFLTGGFFYIRNWIDAGNPVFPAEVNILGYKIFEGYGNAGRTLGETSIIDHLSDSLMWKDLIKSFAIMTDGPGLIIFLGIILLIFYWILGIIKGKTKLFTVESALIAAISFYFTFYLLAPYTYRDMIHNIRYAMPVLLLGIPVLGLLMMKARWIKNTFYTLIFLSVIGTTISSVFFRSYRMHLDFNILWQYPLVYGALVSVILLLIIFVFYYLNKKFKPAFYAGTTTILLLLMIFSFSIFEREKLAAYSYNLKFSEGHRFYGVWQSALWLDQNAPDAKVAFTGFSIHYPFYGRSLEREVDYININECGDCRYGDYKNSENSIRRDPNFANWLRNLELKNKNYIVVDAAIEPGVVNYEKTWMQQNPQVFEEVYRSGETFVYKRL